MKRILLTRQQFPKPNDNGTRDLRYTEKALLRAVVAAGQGPNSSDKTRAARADSEMRRSAILSALDMSGPNLIPTEEFLLAGSTDKATKSLFVGNALCAHAAYSELKTPWLVDIENKKLVQNYKIKKRKTKKRPDFIGQDAHGQWYVFESKGRATKPTPADLVKWKKQAKAITHVKGKKVENNIVSAAHFKRHKEWELLWVDPPAEDEIVEFEFGDISFFDAYYDPIRDLIEREFLPVITEDGLLYYVPLLDAYVGIHKDILTALERRDANAIRTFADQRINLDVDEIDHRAVSVYADGVLIALPQDLDDDPHHKPTELHDEKNEPKSPFSAIEV